MKNILVLALVLIVAALAVGLENRYKLVVDSPVVAKLDRITGDVWIANSGQWVQVRHAANECMPYKKIPAAQAGEQEKK